MKRHFSRKRFIDAITVFLFAFLVLLVIMCVGWLISNAPIFAEILSIASLVFYCLYRVYDYIFPRGPV